MPVDPDASIEITALSWVPDFAKGYVRDLRPRWACEEIGLAYRERLIDPRDKPAWYRDEQPWSQVPCLKDGDVALFEAGAILLHLGEKDERLLPREPRARAAATSWTFAALSSVEPFVQQLTDIDVFAGGDEWARLRRPSLAERLGQQLDGLAGGLGDREWLAGRFSIADILMATVLREVPGDEFLAPRPALAAYRARAMARPAFARAMADQIAAFAVEQPHQQLEGEPA